MRAAPYIEKLRALRLPHAHFESAYRRAYTHAALSQASQIIVIAGPTRVGKTTLGRRLTAELVSTNSEDDGRITLVRVEAATTNQAKFSTKHFTMRMLEELQDPVTSIREGMALRHSQSETHLRLQLERCLRYRQTRYLLVDEAQHLLRSASVSRAGEVIDTLKCLANVTGIAVILMGGYELLSACIQSPHLNGRLTIIDFPPYGDDDGSILEFDRVLLSIEDILPSRPSFFREHHEMLYRGSLGCVGLLFGWTMLALAEMEAQAHRELRLEHFTGTRYAVQNQAIADEIALGASILGWKLPSFGTPLASKQHNVKRKVRVGERLPHRDPGPSRE